MVTIAGMGLAVMLPIIGVSTLYLRHRELDRRLAPRAVTTLFLWLAAVVILLTTLYTLAGTMYEV